MSNDYDLTLTLLVIYLVVSTYWQVLECKFYNDDE